MRSWDFIFWSFEKRNMFVSDFEMEFFLHETKNEFILETLF